MQLRPSSALDKSLKLSEPQFLHLKKGGRRRRCFSYLALRAGKDKWNSRAGRGFGKGTIKAD